MPVNLHKILILRLSSFGDILLTFPLIYALRRRYPDSEIDFVVKKEYSELISANPQINKAWIFDKSTGWNGLHDLTKQLRQKQYDLVLDIHRNIRSWYLRRRLSNAMILKYRKNIVKRLLLVLIKINLFREAESLTDRYLRTAEPAGIDRNRKVFEIHIPSSAYRKAESVLEKMFGKKNDLPLFAFCPGAGFHTKRWPVQQFAVLGNILGERIKSSRLIILGGARDAALGEFIRENTTIPVLNGCGKFSFLESAAVLKSCTAAITNDTGLMHASAALEKPTVAVFGPTTRELGYYPESRNVKTIEASLGCRPCSHNGSDVCPEGHFSCMQLIKAENVWEKLSSFPTIKNIS